MRLLVAFEGRPPRHSERAAGTDTLREVRGLRIDCTCTLPLWFGLPDLMLGPITVHMYVYSEVTLS